MGWIALLDELRPFFDLGMGLLIWLVQLIVYPSFAYSSPESFKSWHFRYTGLITIFVLPLMFGQSGIYLASAWLAGRWHDWSGVVLVAACWAATFLLSVPCHDGLQKNGFDLAVVQRLVRTNWIRTIAWSTICVIDIAVGLVAPEALSLLARQS